MFRTLPWEHTLIYLIYVPIGSCCNCCSVPSLNWIFKNPQRMKYCCITYKVSKELTHCEVLPDLFISLMPVSLLGKLRQWSCKYESIYNKKCLLTKCCRSTEMGWKLGILGLTVLLSKEAKNSNQLYIKQNSWGRKMPGSLT